MLEDPMQEESVIKSEVEKYSTPASQAKRRKRKRSLKNTGEQSLFETDAALMEGYRKSQSKVKKLRRALAEKITLHNITSRKLKHYENQTAEKIRKCSRKRLRIPNLNNKVVRAVMMANSGPHSPVQQTGL